MRFFTLILLVLFILRPDVGGMPAQTGFLVRVWQSQDGLPGNVVRSVVQASDGYLWVATAEGVARFDGYDFELIEPEGTLKRNRLAYSRLFTTSGGQVWVATYQGGLLRAERGKLHEILKNIMGPTPPLVTQLIEDANGIIYFMRGSKISQLSRGGVVSAVTPTPELLVAFDNDLKKQIAGGRIYESGGNPGLTDTRGRFYSAGPGGGLTIAAPGEQPVSVEMPKKGQDYGVNELLEDREGNIWAATHVDGLVRIRQARVDVLHTSQGANERAVGAVLEDHLGSWWFANRSGGIINWTAEGARQLDLSKAAYPRPAAALFEDRDARLWVASRDGSVFRFDNGAFQPQFQKTQIPSKVRSITQDSKGTLWFGGSQGLASFSNDIVRRFGKANGVDDLDFTILQPFPDGRIIAGSSSGAILLGDDRMFQTIGKGEVFKHQWISGILPISENETWFSTLGGGLYLWDGVKWSGFDANDGLPDSRLTCVLDDGKGYLWMGSLSGIIRAGRKELLFHLRSRETPVKWLLLDHTDGLPSRECIGGFQPAGWRGRDGLLWFPTGGGIARVRPELVTPNIISPPVYLQKIRANGVQLIDETGPISTAPGRARLEFHFVGISLGAPEKVTYRARLAGLDDSWRELGTQRIAAFESVPPGQYTFEVLAVNGDGMRSANPARIEVVIQPHFWETGWFYVSAGALVLSIAIAIGWVAARVRMRGRIQLLKIRNVRESERYRIARDLHDDLGASLTEISILAALAAEEAGKHEMSSPLEQLSIKTKHAVSSLDEIVWAVNPREDTLRSLVDYLSAFAHEFLNLAGIPLRLDVVVGIPDFPLKTTQRHSVFLAFREAVNNVAKHSGATSVMLVIAVVDGCLVIRIEDNGCGFEPDYAKGNGLGNLRQRMNEVGGDCNIETHRRRGTTVILTLPLFAPAKGI